MVWNVGRLITMCSLNVCLVNLFWFAVQLAPNSCDGLNCKLNLLVLSTRAKILQLLLYLWHHKPTTNFA